MFLLYPLGKLCLGAKLLLYRILKQGDTRTKDWRDNEDLHGSQFLMNKRRRKEPATLT
jgi:hypothetical protein